MIFFLLSTIYSALPITKKKKSVFVFFVCRNEFLIQSIVCQNSSQKIEQLNVIHFQLEYVMNVGYQNHRHIKRL